MKILVTNDDGISSPGIIALTDALSDHAEVYVCAPDVQRSSFSHAISTNKDIEIRRSSCGRAVMAVECSGTPADSARAGLYYYRDLGIEIDMVFSGINIGANLGTDIFYSGTVGAAVEGAMCGKPSVAVSVCSRDGKDFSYATMLACKCLDSRERVLNINVPDLPYGEVKGTRITYPGPREYFPWFNVVESGDRTVYGYCGTLVKYDDLDEETDVGAIEAGYASITAIGLEQYDRKANERLERIWKQRKEK